MLSKCLMDTVLDWSSEDRHIWITNWMYQNKGNEYYTRIIIMDGISQRESQFVLLWSLHVPNIISDIFTNTNIKSLS